MRCNETFSRSFVLLAALLPCAVVRTASGQEDVAELRRAFDDPLPGRRLEAAKALAQHGRRAIPVLREALSRGSANARRAATDAVVALGATAAELEPLLREALDDEVAWVRAGAAEALGRLGVLEPKTVRALVEHAADPDLFVRVQVMQSLARRGVTSDRKSLLEAAVATLRVQETGWAAKRFAVDILRRHGKRYRPAIPVLLGVLRDPPQGMWDASQQITDLLLGMGQEEQVLAALSERLRHPERGGFKNTLRVVERVGKLALPLRARLEEFARSTENGDQRRAARKTLEALKALAAKNAK